MNKFFRINIAFLIIGVALYMIALLFQINHWPYTSTMVFAGLAGSILIPLSLISLFIFLIIFYIRNRPNY